MSSTQPDGLRKTELAAEVVAPDPAGTVASLGSLGYTFESAIADLVDNSIAAHSGEVVLRCEWNDGDPWVALIDDGDGMDPDALRTAMRISGKGPASARAGDDLGRFGLGLKTASFSQARRLVVSSSAGHGWSTRTWDLEHVTRVGEWQLLLDVPSPARPILDDLQARVRSTGTIVLWQVLGLGGRAGRATADEQDAFYEAVQVLNFHLAMTFHRFLAGGRLRISINDAAVVAWDPFLLDASHTQRLPAETSGAGPSAVRILPYVLPHSRYLTPAQYETAGGRRGWLEQQGFYVYRRDRLILAGGWLLPRMRREERFMLARIAIDVPAELDAQWSLDVRKSGAIPPAGILRDLRRNADACRRVAAATLSRRAGVATATHGAAQVDVPWRTDRSGGRVSCRIDRHHPLVVGAVSASNDRPRILALLRLLEETVPIGPLRVLHEPESADDPEPFGRAGRADLALVAEQLYQAMVAQGSPPAEAREKLKHTSWLAGVEGFWENHEGKVDHTDASHH